MLLQAQRFQLVAKSIDTNHRGRLNLLEEEVESNEAVIVRALGLLTDESKLFFLHFKGIQGLRSQVTFNGAPN